MAAAVTTTTLNKTTVWGTQRVVDATLAYDTGDYAAGGIAITPQQFGLTFIHSVLFQGAVLDVAATPSALVPRWVPSSATAGKIQLFECAGAGASLTEKPAEAMGTGATVRVIVLGS
jgi:hypothetical protein